MPLHRVTHAIPPSSPGSPSTLLAAQPMGESKQWWQGLLSVERAAEEPTPDLPLEPEDENGDAVSHADELPEEELPHHVDDGRSVRSRSEDTVASSGHEHLAEHAPARLARECKRAPKGTRVSCVACRAAGREVLTYLLTYKKGTPRKKASYQITCDYHEPDVVVQAGGRQHRLPCRKTHTVDEDTLESEYAAIRFLVRWVRRGPCFPGSRTDHRDMPDEDFEDESTSGDDEGSFDNEAESAPGSIAVSHAATVTSCWVCGAKHDEADCGFLQLALHDSILSSVEALKPLGQVSRGGLVVPRNLIGCKDVPGDGNCLFHAVGQEIADKFRGHAKLPGPNAKDGAVWRSWLMEYIRTTTDEIDSSTIQEWVAVVTNRPVEQYLERMSIAGGRETWGGFLEASLIAQAWGRAVEAPVGCLMFSLQGGNVALMSWTGSRTAREQIAIVWSGNHWCRLRLKEDGWKMLREAEAV